jgi:hypothetical protein
MHLRNYTLGLSSQGKISSKNSIIYTCVDFALSPLAGNRPFPKRKRKESSRRKKNKKKTKKNKSSDASRMMPQISPEERDAKGHPLCT